MLRGNVQALLGELEECARDVDMAELQGLAEARIVDLRQADDDLASHVARIDDGLAITKR